MAAAIDQGAAAAVAGASQTNGTNAQATTTQAQTPWYSSFSDADLRGYAENKKWADPVEAVKSYRELETFTGKLKGVPPDRLLVVPGADAKPEDWNPVYEKLGRPAKWEDYKLTENLEDPFVSRMAPVLHKHGASTALATALRDEMLAFAQQQTEQENNELRTQQEADIAKLRTEWPGATFDERVALGRRTAQSYGISIDTMTKIEDAMGTAAFLRLFSDIGAKQGEGRFIEGNGTGTQFGMTPEAAQAKVMELRQDKEFGKRYLNGDLAAKREMENLEQIVAAGIRAGTIKPR